MARRAVVLPAPFGPMSPTMRPASMARLTLSSATCEPYFLLKFRASISGAMGISFLDIAAAGRRCRLCGRRCLREQFFGRETKPVDHRQNLRPLLVQKPSPLAAQQQPARSLAPVHAAAAALLDQAFIDQLLVALED